MPPEDSKEPTAAFAQIQALVNRLRSELASADLPGSEALAVQTLIRNLLAELQIQVRRDPTPEALRSPNLESRELTRQATDLLGIDPEGALVLLAEALAHDPDNLDALNNMAICLIYLERTPEAQTIWLGMLDSPFPEARFQANRNLGALLALELPGLRTEIDIYNRHQIIYHYFRTAASLKPDDCSTQCACLLELMFLKRTEEFHDLKNRLVEAGPQEFREVLRQEVETTPAASAILKKYDYHLWLTLEMS